ASTLPKGIVPDPDSYIECRSDVHATGASEVLGQVTLRISTERLRETKASRQKQLAIQGLVSFLLLGILLSALLRRTVVTPVSELDRQAAELGRGDLDTPISLGTSDELGRLALTLDGMRLNLRSSYNEIRANNEELQRLGALKDQTMEQLAE